MRNNRYAQMTTTTMLSVVALAQVVVVATFAAHLAQLGYCGPLTEACRRDTGGAAESLLFSAPVLVLALGLLIGTIRRRRFAQLAIDAELSAVAGVALLVGINSAIGAGASVISTPVDLLVGVGGSALAAWAGYSLIWNRENSSSTS